MPDNIKLLPVTAVILTKNEEKNIGKCISCLEAFAETIVIDSSSEDRTIDIAKEKGARVINFKWNKKFPKKKEWALRNVDFKTEFVFLIDADEFVPQKVIQEMSKKISLIIRFSHPAMMARYGRGSACSAAHVRRSVMVSSW